MFREFPSWEWFGPVQLSASRTGAAAMPPQAFLKTELVAFWQI
jgi:hypothetical protein